MHRVSPIPARNFQPSLKSDYRFTRLPNGIRVVTESIPHVRSVSVGVWINVGSRNEDESENGISHFIEHMAFKGTRRYSLQQIARSLESLGGYLNAFTTKEHTCYYARTLDEHLTRAVDVLSDLVQSPVFDRKEIAKERTVILEELKNIEDDPDDLIHDYLEHNVYHKHPLGYPIIGKADNIKAFGRDDLSEYMHRHYRHDQMVVAAAGHLNHDEMVDTVGKFFRKNGAARTEKKRPRAPKQVNARKLVYDKPIMQAHICLGTLGYSVRDRRRYALLVLNSLLGEGMSSRLFQNIREKYGFAYTVYSFASLLSDTGSFGIYVGTDSKNIDESIRLVYKELDKLKAKPVSAAELKRTKTQLKGTMMLGLESMSNRMMRLGSGELYFGEYHPLDQILRHIEAVRVEDVHGIARELFKAENFSTIIFKPNRAAPQS